MYQKMTYTSGVAAAKALNSLRWLAREASDLCHLGAGRLSSRPELHVLARCQVLTPVDME